ncbi:hypothetical protein [Streptomyces mashuensis]|uniref:hypothetical protein n=1 Tax=Streptomyces mashuensis TaxID=33904 RepID=UPI003570AB69
MLMMLRCRVRRAQVTRRRVWCRGLWSVLRCRLPLRVLPWLVCRLLMVLRCLAPLVWVTARPRCPVRVTARLVQRRVRLPLTVLLALRCLARRPWVTVRLRCRVRTTARRVRSQALRSVLRCRLSPRVLPWLVCRLLLALRCLVRRSWVTARRV